MEGTDTVSDTHLEVYKRQDEEVERAVEAANLRSVISKLPKGLDTMIEEHGANLSGGQRQRISIARAIIRNPKVIILDEATSALDTISEKEIQDALDRLIQGRTTFIVAHRLSTVRGADRILVLDKGKIREEGRDVYKRQTLKNSIIADVVVQGVSIDEAFARFESEGGAEWSQMIVDSLNESAN